MKWKAYRVTFRLLSPMHIGWRKLGNMQQTRPYVTGRVLWGAFTARFTRDLKSHKYQEIGEAVDEQLAFTYFYPAISLDPDKLPNPDDVHLWPWGNDQKKDGQEIFSWMFLGSYASTALSDARSAEEGSLHETEFITPYARSNMPYEDPKPVYLVGYIFEQQEPVSDSKYELRVQEDLLNHLQIGGERSYGWGRVHLAKPLQEVKNELCFSYTLNCNGNRPLITVPAGDSLLAHTETESLKEVENGTVEPLVGRVTTGDTSFGKTVSHAQICWVPGSTVSQEETFQIQPRGIWQRLQD